MAIVTVPGQPTFGGQLGAGLGSGISSGINTLVNMKLENLAKQQKQKSTEQTLLGLGFGERDAALYSALGADNPQLLNTVVKERLEAPSKRYYEDVVAGTPERPQVDRPEGMRQLALLGALGRLGKKGEGAERADSLEPISPIMQDPMERITPTEQLPKPEVVREKRKPLVSDQATKLNNDINRMRKAIASGRLKPRQVDNIAKMITKKEDTLSKMVISEKQAERASKQFEKSHTLQEKRFELQEKKFVQDLSSQKRKEEREDQREIDRDTKESYESIIKQRKAAKENDMRLGRMEQLNKEGNLGGSIFNSVLNTVSEGIFGAGFNLTSLMTADAQEFQKLSLDFLKNVKDIFGARVTQQEVVMYLKTIPSLLQSRDGREKVIKNLQAFNKASKLRYQEMNKLIKENNGRRPANMASKIEERIEKRLNKLAEAFKYRALGPKTGRLSRLKDLFF